MPCRLLMLVDDARGDHMEEAYSRAGYVFVFFLCCSVNVSVCLVCSVLDSVCELFGETIRDVFGCGCCFVAECYGCV